MPGIQILFWILLAILGLPKGWPEVVCINENVTSNSVNFKNRVDNVGMCGAVALRNLLQQYRCQTPNYPCTTPSTLALSNLDLLALMEPNKASNTDGLIKTLGAEGLPDEDCAPVGGLYPDLTEEDINADDWLQRFNRVSQMVARPHINCTDKMFLDELRVVGRINNQDIARLQKIITKGTYDAQTEYLKKNKCENRLFPPIGKFNKGYVADVNALPGGLSGWMRHQISNGVTGFGLSLYTTSGRSAPTIHAVTIVNVRKRCCANYCRNQYQTMDDTGLAWAAGHNVTGGWVDEDLLLSKVEGPGGGRLEWLTRP